MQAFPLFLREVNDHIFELEILKPKIKIHRNYWARIFTRKLREQFNRKTLFGKMDTLDLSEIDVFLELSCFFDDPLDVGNLISGSSAFSKTGLNIWKSMVHVLLKPGLENFEHYFTSV